MVGSFHSSRRLIGRIRISWAVAPAGGTNKASYIDDSILNELFQLFLLPGIPVENCRGIHPTMNFVYLHKFWESNGYVTYQPC